MSLFSRCSCCEFDARYAKPTGPLPCSTFLLGEKPGQEEAYKGLVFVGDTGKELRHTYLPLANLDPEACYISNTVKCRLGDNNNKPTEAQVASCASAHLPGEIEACVPSLLVLMGSTACSLVPKIEIEKDHGLPVWIDAEDSEFLGGYTGWAWPMFHPASGLHDTAMMIPMLEDWERLGRWRKGEKVWEPVEYKPHYGYYLVETDEQLETSFALTCAPGQAWVASDTENDGPRPWSLQYSFMAGSGFAIKAESTRLIAQFAEFTQGMEFILHHSLHDLDEYDRLGVTVSWYRDTMQEAFHLGNLPQGLKALSWRLLGIRMRSWEDIALPPSRAKMVDWLHEVWDEVITSRQPIDKLYKKPRKAKAGETRAAGFLLSAAGLVEGRREWKPIQAERDVRRILSHAHKPAYDLWEKAEEAALIGGGMLCECFEERIGPNPIVSLANAEGEDWIAYSCMDADITGQVGRVLQTLRDGFTVGDGDGVCGIDEDDYDR